MKKFKEYMPTFLFVTFLILCLIYYYVSLTKKEDKLINTIEVVPTLITKINKNTIWCGTFQLIWNDLKDEVVKGDILFENDSNNPMVLDLNKKTFTKKDISEAIYYKKFGFMRPSLKKEIENSLLTKFQEKSDILDNFTFKESSQDYFFYSMLKREFEFKNPFDILSDTSFGITKTSGKELDSNISVLYYKDSLNHAVVLKTTPGDEIILVKGSYGDNFLDRFNSLNLKTSTDFKEEDTISIHNFDLKIEHSFDELVNKEFFIEDESYQIQKALQTLNFKLNNKGGSIKSEAGMGLKGESASLGRHFNYLDDFTLFVKETDKNLPYLAIQIKDGNWVN